MDSGDQAPLMGSETILSQAGRRRRLGNGRRRRHPSALVKGFEELWSRATLSLPPPSLTASEGVSPLKDEEGMGDSGSNRIDSPLDVKDEVAVDVTSKHVQESTVTVEGCGRIAHFDKVDGTPEVRMGDFDRVVPPAHNRVAIATDLHIFGGSDQAMTLIMKESEKTSMPEVWNDSSPCGGEPVVVGGNGLKKGSWTSMEDAILMEYVKKHVDGN